MILEFLEAVLLAFGVFGAPCHRIDAQLDHWVLLNVVLAGEEVCGASARRDPARAATRRFRTQCAAVPRRITRVAAH